MVDELDELDELDEVDDWQLVWHVWRGLDALFTRGSAEMARLAGDRLPGMRGSIAKLMELIPEQGCRQSELARTAGITKQAIGQRLADMTGFGFITVEPHPNDRRAQLVRLTEHGRLMRRATRDLIEQMESEWASEVGRDDYAVFRSVLDRLTERSAATHEPK